MKWWPHEDPVTDDQSVKTLESKQHLVMAFSEESWPGVFQMIQKHIKCWKVGLEE